jgi:hypothetical protein
VSNNIIIQFQDDNFKFETQSLEAAVRFLVLLDLPEVIIQEAVSDFVRFIFDKETIKTKSHLNSLTFYLTKIKEGASNAKE